jgi:hypothetical protein
MDTIDREKQNQWILGGHLPGVAFAMNQRVRVTSGADAGTHGTLISIYALGDDPSYAVETDDGGDLTLKQSQLEPA